MGQYKSAVSSPRLKRSGCRDICRLCTQASILDRVQGFLHGMPWGATEQPAFSTVHCKQTNRQGMKLFKLKRVFGKSTAVGMELFQAL